MKWSGERIGESWGQLTMSEPQLLRYRKDVLLARLQERSGFLGDETDRRIDDLLARLDARRARQPQLVQLSVATT
jgi:hypothetical protein